MTQLNNSRHADLLTAEASEVRVHVIHDLEEAYQPSSPAARLDATILTALRERRIGSPGRKSLWTGRLLRSRLAGVVAACALILGSTAAYLHGQSAAPVSAQTILRRAATAGLAPNQVTHFTYRLTASNGYTGTSDEWVEADGSSAATRLALSNTVRNGGTVVPGLSERLVQDGNTVQVYDPVNNTVTTFPGDQVDQPWASIVVGTHLTEKLGGAAQGAPFPQPVKKAAPGAPTQRTLDGVPVYALPLSSNDNQTMYVDARSYIPRGADWSQGGVSWQARLLRYDTMSPSAVPAGTFGLGAPPTAQMVQAQSDKSDYPVDLGPAFAQACITTPAAFKAAMGQAPDQSMLAVCRQTNPSITSDQLGAALIASVKAQLDAAVAAGQITATQEADQLARMQAKLGDTINSPSGSSAPKTGK